jgi:hypothetical protein
MPPKRVFTYQRISKRNSRGKGSLEKLALFLVIAMYAMLVWYELADLEGYYDVIGEIFKYDRAFYSPTRVKTCPWSSDNPGRVHRPRRA